MRCDDNAEAWLRRIYADLAADPVYQKAPEDIPDRIAMEIRSYVPELQQQIRDVICRWLQSPDPEEVDNALDIADRLKMRECVPIIQQLHEDIKSGHSTLPDFWHTSSQEIADSVGAVIEHILSAD